ncbi:MAG TPA: aminotransferase class I/II-fold pyridoxal phosphate-dependent enzyme [Methylophilaceae bacterium]|nr:aminotransferase class I/II-fold pyridoxal phosphate-dependent enzyme [Methylophilaceae bacterium]
MNPSTPLSQQDIAALFDGTEFRGAGHAIIELLANYLDNSLKGEGKVIDWQAPLHAIKHWQKPLPQEPALSPREFLAALTNDILARTLRIHHPRNLGHQVATPLPIAALCDLVASLTNQAMTVYEAGPSATLIEKQVIQWLCELIGWQDADGVLTSGGAQANLTALLAARQAKAGWNIWQQGVSQGQPLRILACETTHYSVSRAAGIMGLGTDAVATVPMDKLGRMDIAALKAAYQECIAHNTKPFAVAISAGCTPTGSIDPLIEIGTFCREHDLWFHVDGAHGASALLSARLKPMLAGIELADSIVWDGHKLLYMPVAVSAVLFRDPKHSYAAFSQEASYLFQASDTEEAYNLGTRSLECTKRMMGLKLWAAFMLYGTQKLGGLVEHVFRTAKLLAQRLEKAPDFELLMPPQTNIVCFRHVPQSLAGLALSAHQEQIRKKLVETGAFHLTQVKMRDKVWLRTTIMNPLTSDKDVAALLENIRELA